MTGTGFFLNHNCQTLTCSNRLQVLTREGERVEVVASLSQGRTAAAQCGLFTHKSVPAIFEPPYISALYKLDVHGSMHHNINLIEINNKMPPYSRIYYSNVS
jgi:hypothetical protein